MAGTSKDRPTVSMFGYQTAEDVAVAEALDAEFETVSTRRGPGGMALSYITGEQCVSRLNEVLGPAAWSFHVINHDIHANEEVWVLGRLTVHLADGRSAVKEQFGSQMIHRDRSTGNATDIGFDLKGAATDALKRCAVGFGIGLYLYRAAEHPAAEPAGGPPVSPANRPAPGRPAQPVQQPADADLEALARENKDKFSVAFLALCERIRGAESVERLSAIREEIKKDATPVTMERRREHLISMMKARYNHLVEADKEPPF